MGGIVVVVNLQDAFSDTVKVQKMHILNEFLTLFACLVIPLRIWCLEDHNIFAINCQT